jgi:hypothetical protein
MFDVMTKPRFAAPIQPERRNFGRRVMFRHATALVMGGASWSCVVVDKSETGARLRVKDVTDFPDLFKLIIEADDLVVQCAVVHRTTDYVGVQFLRAPSKLSMQDAFLSL